MNLARLIAVSWLVVSCGGSGAKGTGEPARTEPLPPEPSGTRPAAVAITGGLYLGDSAKPATGFELWIIDHEDGGIGRFEVGAEGRINIPLGIFRTQHRYSFHVVQGALLIGDLDFGESTAGIQSVLVYEGGYGFDLGDVVARLTRRGAVDADDPGLSAKVGGGFRLDVASTAGFATLKLPGGINSFLFRSQLNVFDPLSLLYAFYRRGSNPELYAAALAEHSRIAIALSTSSKDRIARLYLAEAGPWLGASRLAAGGAEDTPSTAPLWSRREYTVPKLDAQSYYASVYTGALPPARSFAVFKIQPVSGPTLSIPRLLGDIFAMPPKPVAIALDGGAVAAIDYTLPDAAAASPLTQSPSAQGLLTPFCYGDQGLTVQYDPPILAAGDALSLSDQSRVVVAFDYYGAADSSQTLRLEPAAADFADRFSEVYTETAAESGLLDSDRSWDPHTQTVTFKQTDVSMSWPNPVPVALWPELFLAEAGGRSVSSIRLRVYFRSLDDPGESASALWLRRGC